MLTTVKRQALAQLFRSTAAAFQCDMVRLSGLSHQSCLAEYARFTADRAGEAVQSGEGVAELQERLYRNAYRLGRTPGWLFGVRSIDDVMALGRLLYSLLDIEFCGRGSGEFTIHHCYFSRFYSEEMCRVMSAMDRGLLAGLAGTGDLVFTQRITEGHSCCRGRFSLVSGQPAAGV